MNIKDLFDRHGNFLIVHFDPYRKPDYDEEYTKYWDNLFCGEDDSWGNYGSIKRVVGENLHKIIRAEKWSPFCDAVKLMYAQEHGINTKGNYPAIYMWR